MMVLRLPYPPSANRYWRADRGGKPHLSDEARAYKNAVSVTMLKTRVVRLDCDVAVTIHVYRPRKSGDLDNTLKVLLDSLKGYAFVDDSQVVSINAKRFDDKANPRAEVTIAANSGGTAEAT